MPRLAPLDLNKLTPEQKKVADAIVAGPRGAPARAVRALAAPARAGRPRPEARRILPLQQLAAQATWPSWRSAWSAGTSRRSTSSTPMPASPRKPACRPSIVEAIRTRQTPPFTRDVESDRLRLRHRISRHQPRRRAQLQARDRRLRRARAWSIWWACAATTCWCR